MKCIIIILYQRGSINYVKRDKTCEDILTPDQIKKQNKQADIYDLYIKYLIINIFYK